MVIRDCGRDFPGDRHPRPTQPQPPPPAGGPLPGDPCDGDDQAQAAINAAAARWGAAADSGPDSR